MKTLHPDFENVISELGKRYIRTWKTLYTNFENVLSELRTPFVQIYVRVRCQTRKKVEKAQKLDRSHRTDNKTLPVFE